MDRSNLSHILSKLSERLSMRIPLRDILEMMEIEKERKNTKLSQSSDVLSFGVRFAPSIGMLGTILGMIQLLSSISDPSSIGPYMSVALLTTFYGLFFSLILWTPLQNRMNSIQKIEINGYEQVIHWLTLIERRKPTQYFNEVEETK